VQPGHKLQPPASGEAPGSTVVDALGELSGVAAEVDAPGIPLPPMADAPAPGAKGRTTLAPLRCCSAMPMEMATGDSPASISKTSVK